MVTGVNFMASTAGYLPLRGTQAQLGHTSADPGTSPLLSLP